MTAEENSLKRSNYKIFLFINKYLPYVISLLYMVNTLLYLFGIDLVIFSILGGMSILPMIYFISVSFTFGYCLYHRLPLYYVILNDSINWLEYTIGIPISNTMFISISLILMLLTIIISTILYLKEKKRNR
jgi:predicted lysophospholipase L1 biosynthesis ABC-type transport system permease subunit